MTLELMGQDYQLKFRRKANQSLRIKRASKKCLGALVQDGCCSKQGIETEVPKNRVAYTINIHHTDNNAEPNTTESSIRDPNRVAIHAVHSRTACGFEYSLMYMGPPGGTQSSKYTIRDFKASVVVSRAFG